MLNLYYMPASRFHFIVNPIIPLPSTV